MAADPSPAWRVDGLFGEYGLTWAHQFRGYSPSELLSLPRVTTETGCVIDGPVTEQIQALNILSLYLDQYQRGWHYTAVYLLRDRVDEAGDQQFGLYRPDYTPRLSAIYLHNLTAILADTGTLAHPGTLEYTIPQEPATVHDMLLQKSTGAFELLVWGERLNGSSPVKIRFAGKPVSITMFMPTADTAPVITNRNVSSITLYLSNQPMILQVTETP